MDAAPKIPNSVSPDGREIWDWAAKFSEHTHRQAEIRRLNAGIREIGTVCGDCHLWMKSRLCPRERNVNGRNHGPSMNGVICGKFVETAEAANRRVELTHKRATLLEPR